MMNMFPDSRKQTVLKGAATGGGRRDLGAAFLLSPSGVIPLA